MPLDIHIQQSISGQNFGMITVQLSGSLDTATAPQLEQQLGESLGHSARHVVFDLAELKFISSAGLRVFASTRKTLKERGGQVSFVNMQPQIQEVFEIIKALPGVAVFKDMAEFDRYLAARQRTHTQHN
jgi:anti-sigma B factor antagonist